MPHRRAVGEVGHDCCFVELQFSSLRNNVFNLSSTPTCLLILMHVFLACSPKLSLSPIYSAKSFSTLVCSISVPLTSTLMFGVSLKVHLMDALWYLLLFAGKKFYSYHLSVVFAASLSCAGICLLVPEVYNW